MNKLNLLLIITFSLFLGACKDKAWDERTENLNKGTITLYAESSYQTLVEELVKSYENVYPESKIEVRFAPDNAVLDAMFTDKTRMIITGTALSKEQLDRIKSVNEVAAEQYVIGREAIAVIASLSNPDTVFDFDAFLQSRSAGYSGVYEKTGFVFNEENSAMVSQLLGNMTGYNNMFSLGNLDTVVGYVSKNTAAIGFISFAALSDPDDSLTQAILRQVKVLPVAKADSTGKKIVIPMSQSSIASNDYPFQRYVTVVKGNTPELLGTGFVNFLYRSKASRIMLKAGLVPEKMPERRINIVE
ncbi:MAG TPA: substrate-binding domain-containing protein [Chitinophagales bacterium]|nr:substrate-binding domain-containing protein [Chitinophagales bacterium]HNA59344.1 substrate-binding domain-containing protein [Chitinophagales bacterium]HNF68442.1 substrate-binding domain-containing protein [Chitinophagales bacterium]HNI54699.1 substrate-binding domain-containing protein [Chitinophagales bacterium]HNK97854.1 substrate-binding domain-containing protein [Chitinophagales bacterium]